MSLRRFGETAVQISGAASRLLGWRPEEFWNCTPAELALVLGFSGDTDRPDAETIAALRRRFPDQ